MFKFSAKVEKKEYVKKFEKYCIIKHTYENERKLSHEFLSTKINTYYFILNHIFSLGK